VPTFIQLLKKKRYRIIRKTKTPALNGCPQKSGLLLRLTRVKPKKPNSAQRKVVKVKLSTGKYIAAYLPGMSFEVYPQTYAIVLVRGGRVRDLPGVRYKLIRGALELDSLLYRRNSRSKYGVKRLTDTLLKHMPNERFQVKPSFIFLKNMWFHMRFLRNKYTSTRAY